MSDARKIIARAAASKADRMQGIEDTDTADAILSALEAAGYAVVPKEPTANMLADGALMALTTERHAQRVWEVMITAAKETR